MAKELPTLSSEEAKQKLQAGEVLENVHVERLTWSKHQIDFPIQMVECTIGTLDFNKSTLQQEVQIRRSNIKVFVASEATFEKKCDLKRSKIGRGRVQRAVFKDGAIFESGNLAYTSFYESVFENGKVDFRRCNFTGDATFANVKLQTGANFSHANFENSGVFENTTWGEKADFRNIEVGGDLNFYSAAFDDDLLLIGGVVRLSVDLSLSRHEGKSDLANLTAGRTITLTGVELGEKQGFRFMNAAASSILLDRDTVEGHIYAEIQGNHSGAAKEYGFLRTTFEDINRFDDEDWAYYQFKRMERLERPSSFHPWLLLRRFVNYVFLDLGCGYGTKPFRTLGACLVLVVLFAIVYFFSLSSFPLSTEYGLGGFDKYLHAFNVSLIAFSGNYGDLEIEGPIRILVMLEYMIGVVFLGLFIVAFSRKVIR